MKEFLLGPDLYYQSLPVKGAGPIFFRQTYNYLKIQNSQSTCVMKNDLFSSPFYPFLFDFFSFLSFFFFNILLCFHVNSPFLQFLRLMTVRNRLPEMHVNLKFPSFFLNLKFFAVLPKTWFQRVPFVLSLRCKHTICLKHLWCSSCGWSSSLFEEYFAMPAR